MVVFGDEDETLPAVDLQFGQGHVLALEMREVPAARHFLHRTVIIPGEAVERATQVDSRATLKPQLAPPMQTNIVERADRSVSLADEQKTLIAKIVDDGIARLGHIFLARRELPDIGPHFLVFEDHMGGRCITLG